MVIDKKEDKEFKECYNLWLKKKRLEHTNKNFQEFCILHNSELNKHNKRFIPIFKSKIERFI